MKNIELIKKEIKNINARIEENTQLINKLNYTDECNAETEKAHGREKLEIWKKYSALAEKNLEKIKELSNEIYIDQVTVLYLYDNIKAATLENVKPALKEVLTKYDGKPHGPKTEKAIRDELKAKTGIYIFIDDAQVTVDRITCYTRGAYLLNDNKINAAAVDTLYTWEKYTKNPRAAAKRLIKMYDAAKKALENAKKLTSEYNDEAPTGAADATITDRNFYNTLTW